ncbi:MAG: ADP-ribosylation factor-like protein [Candidatus Thorarchaeota archaeon]|jgi:small GTP-binding protein
MIHNTYLVRISTQEILVATQYWPVEVRKEAVEEFITTREDLRLEDGNLAELPLIIEDDKFIGRDIDSDLLLVFVTDKGEEESSTADRIETATKLLQNRLKRHNLSSLMINYERLIEPSVTTRLKIALVGEGGTGKTTTLHLLLGDTPPLQYVPTIALNLETVENIKFGNYSLVLWDFAGQERFRTLWRFYFHGADVIFLVCDSSLRNVIVSKDILKLIKRDAPKVPVFALANKQDKPNAMKPEVVQKILGIPTYPMVAIDKGRRDEMLRILMTAAAQFVGVVLPDVPATELLRFSDTAAEEAKHAIIEEDEDEYEEVEVIEEILVDEDGQVVESSEDYEIIEESEDFEVVEEIVEVVEDEADLEVIAEVEIDTSEPIVEEPSMIESEVIEEVTEKVEITSETDRFEEAFEMDAISSLMDTMPETSEPESSPEEIDKALAEIEAKLDIEVPPIEFVEVPSSEVESIVSEEETEFDLVTTSTECMESDTIVPISAEEDNGTTFAKDLITEALDADEFVAAEIERVSKEDLDVALEAFSSDEVLPVEDEPDAAPSIDVQALKEIDDILGSLYLGIDGASAKSESSVEEDESES